MPTKTVKCFQNLVHGKHPFTKIALEPRFSTHMLYDNIVTHVNELKARAMDGALQKGIPGGRALRGRDTSHLFFIDDINASQTDTKTGEEQ